MGERMITMLSKTKTQRFTFKFSRELGYDLISRCFLLLSITNSFWGIGSHFFGTDSRLVSFNFLAGTPGLVVQFLMISANLTASDGDPAINRSKGGLLSLTVTVPFLANESAILVSPLIWKKALVNEGSVGRF